MIGDRAEPSANVTRDLNPKENPIPTQSKASEPPLHPDTKLKTSKGPRLPTEQNARCKTRTVSPVPADADGRSSIPMTMSKTKEGSAIIAEEPESVIVRPPSPATRKGHLCKKPSAMSSHPKEPYGNAGDHSNPQCFSQPSPGGQLQLTGQPVSLMSC